MLDGWTTISWPDQSQGSLSVFEVSKLCKYWASDIFSEDLLIFQYHLISVPWHLEVPFYFQGCLQQQSLWNHPYCWTIWAHSTKQVIYYVDLSVWFCSLVQFWFTGIWWCRDYLSVLKCLLVFFCCCILLKIHSLPMTESGCHRLPSSPLLFLFPYRTIALR